MAKPPQEEPKRVNRTVSVADAIGGVLDAALKKRGFATRDILASWPAMAPKPYDRLAFPEQLKWPRGAGHEGATLYLRCAESQRMALAHDAALVATAVNRYFGYYLVREIRLSAEPFSPRSTEKPQIPGPTPQVVEQVARDVAPVENEALRAALTLLGEAVRSKKR